MRKIIQHIADLMISKFVSFAIAVAIWDKKRKSANAGKQVVDTILSATKSGKLLPRLPENIFDRQTK